LRPSTATGGYTGVPVVVRPCSTAVAAGLSMRSDGKSRQK